jgi:hypothetical protein
MGTLVGAFAFFDALLIGVPIAVLAAWLNPLIVFVVAAVAVTFFTVACCSWLDRKWDDWIAGHGSRLEKKLETMRKSRVMRHPVAWIQRGSDGWFALAASLVQPAIVVALARLMTGQRSTQRRIFLGSVAYAIPYSALFALVGLALGDVIRAA